MNLTYGETLQKTLLGDVSIPSYPLLKENAGHSVVLHLRSYCFHHCRLAVSVTVNLAYSSSPQVPMLPVVYLVSGNKDQGFFYSAFSPTEDPLSFSLGNALDYRSSQAGTPQVQLAATNRILFPNILLCITVFKCMYECCTRLGSRSVFCYWSCDVGHQSCDSRGVLCPVSG